MGDEKRGTRREPNPVADMLIWKSYVEKEHAHLRIYDNFNINPATMKIITDKPGVKQNISEEDMKTEFGKTVKKTFEDFYNPPKKKIPFPKTEAQEIGWDHDVPEPRKFRDHKKNGCFETTFADNFYYMKGHSLYSNKNKL